MATAEDSNIDRHQTYQTISYKQQNTHKTFVGNILYVLKNGLKNKYETRVTHDREPVV